MGTELIQGQHLADAFLSLLPPATPKIPSIQLGTKSAPKEIVDGLCVMAEKKEPALWEGIWNPVGLGLISYLSRSEADMALAGAIARAGVLTNVPDDMLPDAVMLCFMQSGLYRPEKHRQMVKYTIPKVIASALAYRDQQTEQAGYNADSGHEQSTWLPPHNPKAKGVQKPTYDLRNFVLNGQSGAMTASMLTDTFILGRLALLGQWTAFYAKPNHGKTLLVIWQLIQAIKSGAIKGADVFYINADDTHKGLVFKLTLAEKHGFNMLAPGHQGFKPAMLADILLRLIENGEASGKIIILDTLKKFTDIMDKKIATAFGEVVRQFISHGGSVIVLAHVNKHRGEDGKVIFSGTSDVVDDADCAYTLDIVQDNPASRTRTVKFDNIKSRGDVALTASYTYDHMEGATYQDRLDSIKPLNEAELKQAQEARCRDELLTKHSEAIEAITSCLLDDITLKTELIKEATERSTVSKAKITTALVDHTGAYPQLWCVEVRDKNAHNYHLNRIL